MENTEPVTSVRKPARKLKPSDVIIVAIIAVIIVALVATLLKQLGLKQEVNAATTVSNKVINDIRQVNVDDARSVADQSFQKDHPKAELTSLFTTINTYAKGTPTVASQIVTNTKDSQNVGIVYKYTGAKTPFYIRIVTTKPKGADKWQLAAMSGGNDQKKLENNQR